MKKLILSLAFIAGFGSAMAQEGNDAANREQCLTNASLFTESCKIRDYASAAEPWESVYRDCPDLTKNIYIYGPKIIEWQISQTQDTAMQAKLFAKLMGVFDTQVQYFGETEGKKAVIILKKAMYYRQFRPTDTKTVYDWMRESVSLLQQSTDPAYIQSFIQVSDEMYKADNNLAENYIADYNLCSTILNQLMEDTTSKKYPVYKQVKMYADQLFATSGVADCDKMNAIFLPAIETNKDNLVYLTSIMNLFKSLDCRETEAYYTASTYSFNIDPSAEAAGGLGRMYFAKGDYNKAIEYLNQSINLEENKSETYDEYLILASAYMKLNNDYKVKECCKLSLEINPKQGTPYILLASIYASAKVSDDPVLQKAVYWAAVDQLRKGREVETKASVIERINSLIAQYSQYFPTKEQVFMHDALNEGQSYYVGGLVGETTTVRGK
ncbi:MAG: hypothetical protein MJ002_07940 [Paludibacteraceae bacterium]|nr:hypothetical protein [Paludibacteraceae bacterium]